MGTKTYWNGNGTFQSKFDELEQIKCFVGFDAEDEILQKYRELTNAYYKFYNDGKRAEIKGFKGLSKTNQSIKFEKEIDKVIEQIIARN